MGIFDVNPGKCKDSITFKDNTNTIDITAESQNDFMESIIITTGPTLSMTLRTCFQYSRWDRENIFEVKASRTGKSPYEIIFTTCSSLKSEDKN